MKTFIASLMLTVVAAVASAQQPSPAQGGFVPIDQLPAPEPFPAAPLVIAAYAFVWLAVAFYIWAVWRRLDRVEQELKAVTARAGRGAGR